MSSSSKSLEDAANQTLGSENVADFQSRLSNLRSEMSGLADTLTNMSTNGSDQVRQAVATVFAEMKSRGNDGLAEAETRASDAVDAVVKYARKNPLRSLGIAAGLGVLLGVMCGRK